MRTWVAVNKDGMGVDIFQADQDYIDHYKDRVVTPDHITTPPWWDESAQFIDVTDTVPQPSVTWKYSKGVWTSPPAPIPTPPTPEQQIKAEDDAFIASMVKVIKNGGTLTQDQRDRLMVLQLDRTAVLS